MDSSELNHKWNNVCEQVKTYEFDTEKEMDAFLFGVDESNGWLSYDIAIHPEGKAA